MSSKKLGFKLNRAGHPEPMGLYDPQNERDACGTGFICRLDNQPTHTLVESAVQILVNLEHRGAVGGDDATGDGAGLLLSIPDAFFRKVAKEGGFELPSLGEYAVGMVFLPTEGALADRCVKIMEDEAKALGFTVLGWRDVPVYNGDLGVLAKSTEPKYVQIFLSGGGIAGDEMERKLYVLRRMAEKGVAAVA